MIQQASGQTYSESLGAKSWLLLLEAVIGTIALSAIASATHSIYSAHTAQS